MNNLYKVVSNELIAKLTYKMVLEGNTSNITKPGQFINIKIGEGYQHFLRRPISICDYDESTITIIYKVFGSGTQKLSETLPGEILDVLSPLGNGYTIQTDKQKQLLIGGGVGVPPLYRLAKELYSSGIEFSVVLGFNTKKDIFLMREFQLLGAKVCIATMDGTYGFKGNVVELLHKYELDFDYYYACGPEKMLHALVAEGYEGQLSFEERMGCGFGACMGCSHKTTTSFKRICKEGPVLESNEVVING